MNSFSHFFFLLSIFASASRHPAPSRLYVVWRADRPPLRGLRGLTCPKSSQAEEIDGLWSQCPQPARHSAGVIARRLMPIRQSTVFSTISVPIARLLLLIKRNDRPTGSRRRSSLGRRDDRVSNRLPPSVICSSELFALAWLRRSFPFAFATAASFLRCVAPGSMPHRADLAAPARHSTSVLSKHSRPPLRQGCDLGEQPFVGR